MCTFIELGLTSLDALGYATIHPKYKDLLTIQLIRVVKAEMAAHAVNFSEPC